MLNLRNLLKMAMGGLCAVVGISVFSACDDGDDKDAKAAKQAQEIANCCGDDTQDSIYYGQCVDIYREANACPKMDKNDAELRMCCDEFKDGAPAAYAVCINQYKSMNGCMTMTYYGPAPCADGNCQQNCDEDGNCSTDLPECEGDNCMTYYGPAPDMEELRECCGDSNDPSYAQCETEFILNRNKCPDDIALKNCCGVEPSAEDECNKGCYNACKEIFLDNNNVCQEMIPCDCPLPECDGDSCMTYYGPAPDMEELRECCGDSNDPSYAQCETDFILNRNKCPDDIALKNCCGDEPSANDTCNKNCYDACKAAFEASNNVCPDLEACDCPLPDCEDGECPTYYGPAVP